MTGYALRQAIRDVLGHFWRESFGQIYPTLSNLERQGLVTRLGAGRSAPYALTDAGLGRLRGLLAQPVQHLPQRNGLMLRLFFGRQLGAATCRQLVLDARGEAERELVQFVVIRDEIESEVKTEADHPYWLLTISAGEHSARATIAWANETLVALDRIEGST